ncbi:MAG: hypothetical protein MMC33_010398 [Icmadophila ericetorum]|nr:hypothetical protein [Icmadophila ericetorum]
MKLGKFILILAVSIFISRYVGGYRFMSLGLAAHPSFGALVSILKTSDATESKDRSSSQLLVDIGCCVGQDIRSLVYAGVPGSRIVGVDLDPAFVQLGYSLFRDKEKLGAQFLFGDLLTLNSSNETSSMATDTTSSPVFSSSDLSGLIGRVSIVWAAAFLHLWDLPGQIAICHKMLMLLQDKPGVRILGRQVGSRDPGLVVHITNKGGLMYKHNPDSFRKMWDEVLGQTYQGDGISLDRSREKWNITAWFEEDLAATDQKHQEAGHKPDVDWLSKVATDSAKATSDSAENQSPGEGKGSGGQNIDARFLVWEVERIS